MDANYFVVWYEDGKFIKGTSLLEWRQLPHYGIICVMEYFDRGRAIHANAEYYWYDLRNGKIDHGHGEGYSSFDTACPPPSYAVAKQAPKKMIKEKRYEQIMEAAMALEEA